VSTPEDDLVPNPYKAAIKAARGQSVSPAATLKTALDKAVTAMESGAWEGGKSDTFYRELSGHRGTVRKASTDSLQEFDDAADGMPSEVPRDSWYVHWARSVRNERGMR
jgi:hypothetical protein